MAETSNHLCCWQETPKGRERLWCKICRDEGSQWLTPEPCSHILEAKPGEYISLAVAMNSLRELLNEQPANSPASADQQ
jgi:hypothetical protein